MAKDVIMPVLGMNQDSGVLVSWLKQEGDTVQEGEPLMEVETDKAVMEIEATASGTLVQVSAAPGDDIPTGTVIARIVAEGEAVPDAPPSSAGSGAPAADSAGPEARATAPTPPAPPAGEAPSSEPSEAGAATPARAHPDAPAGRTLASPKARRLAEDRGIPLASLQGSGPHGAVVARDVPATAPAPAPLAAPVAAAGPAASEHLERVVRADALGALLDRLAARSGDAPPPLAALIAKFAAATAAKRGLFGDDTDGIDLVVGSGTDPRVHVAGADRLGIRDIAAALAAETASEDDGASDAAPPFLTVVVIDDLRIDAVRTAPSGGAALGVGAIEPRALVVGDSVEVVPSVTLTLTSDARTVDPARAARAFDDLVGLVADPSELVVLF